MVSSKSSGNGLSARSLGLSVFTFVLTAGMIFYAFRLNQSSSTVALPPPIKKVDDEDEVEETAGSSSKAFKSKTIALGDDAKSYPSLSKPVAPTPTASSSPTEASETPSNGKPKLSTEEINKLIEDADKRGKIFFKAKNYLEAASCFTEALDILAENSSTMSGSNNKKQVITLTNNRSAMYEKGGLPELVLEDCERILELDMTHQKARLRKLRVLEGQDRFMDALVEVCALQLKFMQDNREQLRMGIPITPPIPQSKVEDLMGKILLTEVPRHFDEITSKRKENPDATPLPSVYTILQLLKSFSGYNSWMAAAARDGDIATLTKNIEEAGEDSIEGAKWMLKRGRRYAFEFQFEPACKDFEVAFDLVEKTENGEELFGEEFIRLLEWVAMCKHLKYNLDDATKYYERCTELEPNNAELFVKRAGVKMDGGDTDAALKFFDSALSLNSTCTDALLHRANLFMIQGEVDRAKADLKRAIKIQPNNLLAHLRLATVFMTMQDLDSADSYLRKAEKIDKDSSEVHSYRGEMHFSKGELPEAKEEFEKAMKCDSKNATPYVNAALAAMNMPGPQGPPDIKEAVDLLEKALEIDPQFHTAYVHLGQLKLTMAQNLTDARKVADLYDQGLKMCCRTIEELRDIVSMRILTIAQIDAAVALKMETLNMQ